MLKSSAIGNRTEKTGSIISYYEMDPFKKELNLIEHKRAVIFTCTYYNDVRDLRFHQCISTIRHSQYIPIVIVDGSPPEVHEALRNTDALVFRESDRFGNGKGGALREAAQIAASLPGVNSSTWLCWQEAEKSDMIRCWQDFLFSTSVKDSDEIITPNRDDSNFKKSYPIEQYHSESYGNYYLNCVMRRALDENTSSGIGNIDWHFGPFAFRQKLVQLWTSYKGNSYDAQLVPIVHGIRKGYRINTDITVPFVLDEKMKQQEEGNIEFIEKRLNQLNSLDPRVKMAWSEEFYCDL